MAEQYSVAMLNAMADAQETTIGTAGVVKLFTGSLPANCAAANSGTELVSITTPSDWVSAPTNGVKTILGTWTGTASAGGSGTAAGHYRHYASNGTTCHKQGTAGATVNLTTNNSTAASGNVLNFASTTGVVVGQKVSGTGIPTGVDVTVVALTSTTVTVSHTLTSGVSNSTAIAFKYDLELNNASIATGQTVTITGYTITVPGL